MVTSAGGFLIEIDGESIVFFESHAKAFFLEVFLSVVDSKGGE